MVGMPLVFMAGAWLKRKLLRFTSLAALALEIALAIDKRAVEEFGWRGFLTLMHLLRLITVSIGKKEVLPLSYTR